MERSSGYFETVEVSDIGVKANDTFKRIAMCESERQRIETNKVVRANTIPLPRKSQGGNKKEAMSCANCVDSNSPKNRELESRGSINRS